MKYNKSFCDTHSHTSCSFDEKSSMEEMCERALELGLFNNN